MTDTNELALPAPLLPPYDDLPCLCGVLKVANLALQFAVLAHGPCLFHCLMFVGLASMELG